VLIIILILVSSQQKTRYLHVYLRSLINHVQLILIIAAFNYNWPDSLQSFFDISRPFSQPFSEFIELDCLTHNYERGKNNNTVGLRLYFIQVLFLALLPIIFVGFSWLGWKIQNMRVKSQQRKVNVENKGSQQEKRATHINDDEAKEDIRIREHANKNFGGKIL